MEVKPGYKQTEVGVIPEDWKVQSLGSLAAIASGGTPSRRMPGFWNGDIPWVTTREINFNTILDAGERISTLGLESSAAKLLHPGTLLLALYGQGKTRGKVAVLGIQAATNQACASIALSPGASRAFVFHFLASHYRAIRGLSNSGSQENLSGQIVRSISIPLPPTAAEQEAIAEALSDTDALIESLEQLVVKKRQLKQGAMQELLTGKKRLPGFKVKPGYKHTAAGELPEDWAVKCLGDLFEITSSKRVFQSEWKGEGVPFYRARELAVLGERGCVTNELFISEEMYGAYKRMHGVPGIGDMLVTGVGTLGKAYVVSDEHEFYFKDGNIIWFKILGTVNSQFLRQLYLTSLITKQISDASAGTTVGTYTVSGAKKTAIPFPLLGEQAAIAAILSDMDAEIATLDAKLNKSRQLKQGMMQELLTGRIRLV